MWNSQKKQNQALPSVWNSMHLILYLHVFSTSGKVLNVKFKDQFILDG